jgi:vancomycin resistance protein YoaR
MDTQIQIKPLKSPPKRIIIVTLTSLIILLLVVITLFTFYILNSDTVYNGIYVNNIYVGGLNKTEAIDLLKKDLQKKSANLKIVLKCKDSEEILDSGDLNLSVDFAKTVDNAFAVGRTGNIFRKFYDILNVRKNNIIVHLAVTYDHIKVESAVQSLYNNTFIDVKEAQLSLKPDQVSIISGHNGEKFDKNKLLKQVISNILKIKSGTISIPLIITEPAKIDVDSYYKQIYRKAKNATAKVVKNKLQYSPEENGRDIDKAVLSSIVSEVESKADEEKVLPVTFTQPLIKLNDITSKLFKDTLYTYSTYFNTWNQNNLNRSKNIKLAVSKINGTVLGAGEIFSFNKVVGARTVAAGYEEAFTYVGNTVIPGTGGGICQVSSTLYNAVLYSDLQVVERRNHRFTVSYVPYGIDATVSYGTTDFRFKNSTKWPLIVNCWVTKNNKLSFSILGTNDTPQKKVELKTVILGTSNFSRIYTNDPSLPQGKYKVTHTGYKGYVVDTYKIVKMNGKVISNKKITHSVYQPLNELVLRGTKKSSTHVVTPKPKVTRKPKPSGKTKPTVTPKPKPKPTDEPLPEPTSGPASEVTPDAG